MPQPYIDPRFRTVGLLHKEKQIKSFADIFKYIPRSIVATEIHVSHGRLTNAIKDPGLFTYNEVARMAELFGIKHRDLSVMIEKK
jgi:hypothetical protein